MNKDRMYGGSVVVCESYRVPVNVYIKAEQQVTVPQNLHM